MALLLTPIVFGLALLTLIADDLFAGRAGLSTVAGASVEIAVVAVLAVLAAAVGAVVPAALAAAVDAVALLVVSSRVVAVYVAAPLRDVRFEPDVRELWTLHYEPSVVRIVDASLALRTQALSCPVHAPKSVQNSLFVRSPASRH